MRPSITAALWLVLVTAMAGDTAAQNVPEEIAQLKLEIGKLHLEMLQQRAEFQSWKVQNLTAWLEQTKSERQRTSNEVQESRQEVAEVENFKNPIGQEPGPELTELREKLRNERLPVIESRLQSLLDREAALGSELHREAARLSSTQREIQALEGSTGPRK